MLSSGVLPRGTDRYDLSDRFYVEAARGTDMELDRAFLVSYLLTGNMEAAEAAVLLALESWKPAIESAECLFLKIVQTAAGTSIEGVSFAAASYLPPELQNVLKLAGPLRRSFVLRILAGLPAELCAKLLNVDSRLLEAYLRRAFVCLGHRVSEGRRGHHGEAYLS